MVIGLFGHGKMGRAIEAIALKRGHEIGFIADAHQPAAPGRFEHCDVIIEFSIPELALAHITMCLEAGTPIVIGTTGWYDYFDQVVDLCKEKDGTMLPATNFSIGVNLFFAMNKIAAKLFNGRFEYQVSINETHHVHKLDAPSGTAITLAEQIITHHENYQNWKLIEENTPIPAYSVPITSQRIDEVPGTHAVKYSSPIDDIEFIHQAHNREGFAIGAVIAAEWVFDKKGIYSMEEVLNFDEILSK